LTGLDRALIATQGYAMAAPPPRIWEYGGYWIGAAAGFHL